MPVNQLSDANPDGTVLGQSPTDRIGFYGVATPAQQVQLPPAALDPPSALALVNALRTALINLGLMR
jgi:hypothetical protein